MDQLAKPTSIYIPNELFFAEVQAQIKEGKKVKIRVRGHSMLPFLRNNDEALLVAPYPRTNPEGNSGGRLHRRAWHRASPHPPHRGQSHHPAGRWQHPPVRTYLARPHHCGGIALLSGKALLPHRQLGHETGRQALDGRPPVASQRTDGCLEIKETTCKRVNALEILRYALDDKKGGG